MRRSGADSAEAVADERSCLEPPQAGPLSIAMRAPQDCLVTLLVTNRRVVATVAWMEDDGENVAAHKVVECEWESLDERGRRQAVAEVLTAASTRAGVEIYSVFASVVDTSLRANFATGFADLGQEMILTAAERDLALARAAQQPIGTDREVLHALPQQWALRRDDGDMPVEEPVGQRASRLTCHVLLVTAGHAQRESMARLLEQCDVTLEGMIAQPVALYAGMRSLLRARGTTLIIDCGALTTSLLLHRKGRLVHLETHAFGGDDLTKAIAEQLALDPQAAEMLKRGLDLGVHIRTEISEGQTYLWREVQEKQRLLAPAARICVELLQSFFAARAQHFRDLDLLAQTGRIHLTGRAAALGGLTTLVQDAFRMPTVLGSAKDGREPSSELADLVNVGLIRQAADERARRLAERNASGIRQAAQVATGIWSWLMAKLS